MYGAGELFGSFESALDECLVDDHLGCYVRQFTSLPGFDLLSHRLKVALHPVNANRDAIRDAINERERLRVLRQHRREVSHKRHIRTHEHEIAVGHDVSEDRLNGQSIRIAPSQNATHQKSCARSACHHRIVGFVIRRSALGTHFAHGSAKKM